MAEQAGPSGHRTLAEGAKQDEAVSEETGQEAARAASSTVLLAPAATEAPAGCEDLECPICRNVFDPERHVPTLLECLHTFCLECLRQLQLRAARSLRGRAAIRCPLCCHRSALPQGGVRNLPVNTKRLEASLLRLSEWESGPACQRPLPEQSGQGASPLAEDGLGCSQEGGSDLCCVSWRNVVGCLCVVLAVLLFAATWLRWVPLPLFLALAVALVFCSTLPFLVMYFKFSRGPRTLFLRTRETPSG